MGKYIQQDSFCLLRFHLRHRGHKGFKPPENNEGNLPRRARMHKKINYYNNNSADHCAVVAQCLRKQTHTHTHARARTHTYTHTKELFFSFLFPVVRLLQWKNIDNTDFESVFESGLYAVSLCCKNPHGGVAQTKKWRPPLQITQSHQKSSLYERKFYLPNNKSVLFSFLFPLFFFFSRSLISLVHGVGQNIALHSSPTANIFASVFLKFAFSTHWTSLSSQLAVHEISSQKWHRPILRQIVWRRCKIPFFHVLGEGWVGDLYSTRGLVWKPTIVWGQTMISSVLLRPNIYLLLPERVWQRVWPCMGCLDSHCL